MKDKNLGFIEGWLSIVINTALFFVKFWAGTVTGSVAMVADAWHTLSDTLTSVVVLVGFWIQKKPADDRHPFGHGRAESIASLVIATLLAVVGFSFGKESLARLVNRVPAAYGTIALLIFVASALIKEALAQFSIWAGRKINAHSLIADGWHHRSDAVASALIVVGGLASSYAWWIDGVLGLIVSGLIIYTAAELLMDVSSSLLGQAASPELERQVKKLAEECCGEQAGQIHHIHVHKYGDHVELTLHMRVEPTMTVEQAHQIATAVEKSLREKLSVEATVHIEPS
ncbi:cation transporter [Coprothermobacteraceae bacterium]|nr:cation transporter [Coprothermobacteraceae bacterium]